MTSSLGSLGTIVKGWLRPQAETKEPPESDAVALTNPLEALRIHTPAPDPQRLPEKVVQFKAKVTLIMKQCISPDGRFKTSYSRKEAEVLEKHIQELYKLDDASQQYARGMQLKQWIHDADKLYLHFKDIAKAYGQTPMGEKTILIQNPNPKCITLSERATIVKAKKNAAPAVSSFATQRAIQEQFPFSEQSHIISGTPLYKYQTLIQKLESFYNTNDAFRTLTPELIESLNVDVANLASYCENVIISNPKIVDDPYFHTLNGRAVRLYEAYLTNTSPQLTNAVSEPPTADHDSESDRDEKIVIFEFQDVRVPVQPGTRIRYVNPKPLAFVVNYLRTTYQLDLEGADEFQVYIPDSCMAGAADLVEKLYRRYRRHLRHGQSS